jgi:hypothetical protein
MRALKSLSFLDAHRSGFLIELCPPMALKRCQCDLVSITSLGEPEQKPLTEPIQQPPADTLEIARGFSAGMECQNQNDIPGMVGA